MCLDLSCSAGAAASLLISHPLVSDTMLQVPPAAGDCDQVTVALPAPLAEVVVDLPAIEVFVTVTLVDVSAVVHVAEVSPFVHVATQLAYMAVPWPEIELFVAAPLAEVLLVVPEVSVAVTVAAPLAYIAVPVLHVCGLVLSPNCNCSVGYLAACLWSVALGSSQPRPCDQPRRGLISEAPATLNW